MAIVTNAKPVEKPVVKSTVKPLEDTVTRQMVDVLNKQQNDMKQRYDNTNKQFIDALHTLVGLKKRVTLHSITRDAKGRITDLVMDVEPIMD